MAAKKNRKIKILSPVNSLHGGVRVIGAGADEIYCGVTAPKLDLVLYRGPKCEIPTYDELRKLTAYAHSRDVRVLLTVNQPFMTDSMEDATRKHLSECASREVDAFIVGDLGVFSLIKEMGLDVKLYASTYLVSKNRESVNFLTGLGFDRVVLDRQLTIEEIELIAKRSGAEIEVFVHGGGCSNTNGNCYLYHYRFPEMERANLAHQGLVKTPCTLPFDLYERDKGEKMGSAPVMDAFEFCSLCKLPELVDSGIAGLKIEGRGDPVWCQESETRVYRELVDLLEEGNTALFEERLRSIRTDIGSTVINPKFPNLKAFYCEQKRCYYQPHVHTPYKLPVSWQSWTKAQFAGWQKE